MNTELQITQDFETRVKCQLPGTGRDSFRDFEFDATFELISSDDWETLLEENSKSEALDRVLKNVGDQVKPVTATINGEEVTFSPREVVIRNAMTCDAAFMHYHLYVNRNSRDKAIQASQSKNSKRSRKR